MSGIGATKDVRFVGLQTPFNGLTGEKIEGG
jgi:hypothetical protein